MDKTKIDWCDSTWNPVTGCLRGCEYCYARGIAERFSTADKCNTFIGGHPVGNAHKLNEPAMVTETGKKAPYPFGFEPTLHRYRLNDYIGRQGRNIFVCSMSDLFGEWVPDSWIKEVFEACEKAPQHNYLFLTKNPQRYDEYSVDAYTIPGIYNFWYGMSVTTEDQLDSTWLLPEYCHTFISIEPMLEDFNVIDGDLRLSGLEWVIIGAETGHRINKIIPKKKWIDDIVNACVRHGAYVFMKSSLADIWGEPLIQEFPEELRREQGESI